MSGSDAREEAGAQIGSRVRLVSPEGERIDVVLARGYDQPAWLRNVSDRQSRFERGEIDAENSPLGKALRGKQVGDEVVVRGPLEEARYIIEAIEPQRPSEKEAAPRHTSQDHGAASHEDASRSTNDPDS